jgi:hypothetical protein
MFGSPFRWDTASPFALWIFRHGGRFSPYVLQLRQYASEISGAKVLGYARFAADPTFLQRGRIAGLESRKGHAAGFGASMRALATRASIGMWFPFFVE